jgi:hypothetical protein
MFEDVLIWYEIVRAEYGGGSAAARGWPSEGRGDAYLERGDDGGVRHAGSAPWRPYPYARALGLAQGPRPQPCPQCHLGEDRL